MSAPDGTGGKARPSLEFEGITFKHEIAGETAISGKIHFPGDARIDGRLKGEVRADGLLVVSENALLHANVRADRLVLLGTMHGNVFRTRLAELCSGSRLIGNVESEHLVVHPGAVLEGRCQVGKRQEREPSTPNVILLERPLQANTSSR